MTVKNKSASSQVLPVVSIPGYKIRSVLGRGGMATVYLAVQESINREVALKILAPDHTDVSFSERFLREAHIISKLTHPNIVTIYDAGVHQGYNYIAMEYIAGRNLIEAHSELSYRQKIDIIRQVALALEYAGKKGYVHRDIKPENIMLADDGRAILTDFGIARGHDIESGLTLTGKAIGTPYFMSPEQTKGQPADHRSDIYSLGIVLFQSLTGYVPYDGPSVVAIGIKHISSPIPTLPRFMELLQPIINRCLAKDPRQRYQSAQELHDALATISEADLDFIAAKARAMARFSTGIHSANTMMEYDSIAIPPDQRSSRYAELSRPFHKPASKTATSRSNLSAVKTASSRYRLLGLFLVVFGTASLLAYHKRHELEQLWLTQLEPMFERYLANGATLSEANETDGSVATSDTALDSNVPMGNNTRAAVEQTGERGSLLTDLSEVRLQVRLHIDKLRMNPGDRISQQALRQLQSWYISRLDQALSNKDIVKAGTLLAAYREDFHEPDPRRMMAYETQIKQTERLLHHLQQARVYHAANAIDKPDGANALEEYLAALRIAPNDDDVKAGLLEIARYFHDKATQAQRDARYAEALGLTMSGLRAVPDEPALNSLHNRLLAQLDTQRQLSDLVQQANQLLKQGHVITPAEHNAHMLYLTVLEKEPRHKAARAGLEQVENWFVGQISQLFNKQELLAARDLVQLAQSYFPNSKRYTSLKSEIDTAIDTTLPKISQVSFSAQPVSNVQTRSNLDKLPPGETLYGGFSYKNFYAAGSLVEIRLTDQDGTQEYAKQVFSLRQKQGEYFFELRLPEQGNAQGNYSVEFYLNDARILKANLSGLH